MTFLFAVIIALLASPQPAHKFHVSYSRVAVEGTTLVSRVRFFKDDLETALAAAASSPTFSMEISQKQDSLFLAYFSPLFTLNDGSSFLTGSIIGSGEEFEGSQAMWWYLVQYEAQSPIKKLHIVNKLLVETFEDQKNIVQVQHFPSEKTWSLYFVDDAEDYDLSFN